MWGIQRFDPLQPNDSNLKEAAGGGALGAKLQRGLAKGGAKPRHGHLSGAQRRAKARAKAEGKEYVPTSRPPRADPDPGPAAPDPVRREGKKRRVQERLEGNAVHKPTAPEEEDEEALPPERPAKQARPSAPAPAPNATWVSSAASEVRQPSPAASRLERN